VSLRRVKSVTLPGKTRLTAGQKNLCRHTAGACHLYGANLSTYLDNGDKLFMSSIDGLDRQRGELAFVHDHLDSAWDDVRQHDVDPATIAVTAVPTQLRHPQV
jgi:hypothetical protein